MGLLEGNSMKYVSSNGDLDVMGMSVQLRNRESDTQFDIPLLADDANLPDLDPPNANCLNNTGLSVKRASYSNYPIRPSKRRYLSAETEFDSGSQTVGVSSSKNDTDGISRQRKLFLEILSMRIGSNSNEPVKEGTSVDEIVDLDSTETKRRPVEEANEGSVGEISKYAFEKDFRNLGHFFSGKIKAHCDDFAPRNTSHSLNSFEDEVFALPDLECPSYNLVDNDMKYKGMKRNTKESQRPKFSNICSPKITTVCNSAKEVEGMSRSRKLFLDIVSGKRFGVSAGSLNDEVEERMKYIYDYLRTIETRHETNEDTSYSVKDLKKKKHKRIRLVSRLSKTELQSYLTKHQSKLWDIYYGKMFSRRHEDYKRGGKAKCQLTFQVNISPFRDEQLDHVVQFLMAEFYGKLIKDINYILKVLFAEALIFIYMDFHGIDYGECDERMVQAAFNEENADFL